MLAPGQRTGTSWWRVRGRAGEPRFTTYHRVLNRARWAALPASPRLLGGIGLLLVPPGAALGLGADDTVERRRGRKITAKGCYRDAVRSAKTPLMRGVGLQGGARRVRVAVP